MVDDLLRAVQTKNFSSETLQEASTGSKKVEPFRSKARTSSQSNLESKFKINSLSGVFVLVIIYSRIYSNFLRTLLSIKSVFDWKQLKKSIL